MKKIKLILFIICIVFVISNLAINAYYSNVIKKNSDSFISNINTVDHYGNINLLNLTDFEWDSLYIFSPYSNSKYCIKVLGKQRGVKFINSNSDLDTNMVFLNKGKAICYLGGTAEDLGVIFKYKSEKGFIELKKEDNIKINIQKDNDFYTLSIK